jgi:hypothetical protein
MSPWNTALQSILSNARDRARGVPAEKTASAGDESGLVKQAGELADALDVLATSSPTTGTSLRNFLVEKAAMELGESSTRLKGQQAEPPRKTKTPASQPGPKTKKPEESTVLEGKMPEMPFAQKKAEGEPVTLFDIINESRVAASLAKQASGETDIQTWTADQGSGLAPSKNEGVLRKFLASSAAITGMTKRDAKAPTRARLMEAFKNVNDPANAAAAQAAFPNATQKGRLKIASSAPTRRSLREVVER